MKPKPLAFSAEVLSVEQELPDVTLGSLSAGKERWRVKLGLDATTFLTVIIPTTFLPSDAVPDLQTTDKLDLIINIPLRAKAHAISDPTPVIGHNEGDPDGGPEHR